MKTKILTAISILLAIPTYGISIIVWIIIKYQYDKYTATRVLINAAVMSYKNNGKNEIRYGVNNAALPLLFDCFGGRMIYDGEEIVSGVLSHPITQVPMRVTMTQSSENKLIVRATDLN